MTMQEHQDVAVSIATAITHRIVEVLPAIQEHLSAGGKARGLTARVSFRLGGEGETLVVADLDFAAHTGDEVSFPITMSANGGLMLSQPLALPTPQGMNGGQPAAPAPAPVPTQGRDALPPPQYGGEMTAPPDSPVSGPIPTATTPQAPAPAQGEEFARFQQWQAQQNAPAPAPAAPDTPAGPRIRPRMAGEENLS